MEPADEPSRSEGHRATTYIPRVSRYLASGPATIATSIAIATAALVAGMALSRGLGPVGRGEVAALLLWGSTAFDVGALGTPHAVAYFAASTPHDEVNPGMSITLKVFPLLAGLAVIVFLALAFGSGDDVRPSPIMLAVMLAWIMLFLTVGLLTRNAQGRGRMALFNVGRFLSGGSPAIWILALALVAGLTVQSAIVAYVIGLATATAVLVRRGAAGVRARRATVTATQRREFWKYSFWSMVSVLAVKGNRSFDLLLLSLLGTAADVGFYAVAASSALTVALLGESLGMHVFHRVASEADSGRRRRVATRSLLVTLGLSVSLGALFWLLAPTLIPFVYGSDFAPAVTPARILIVAGIAVSTSRLLGAVLNALGRPRAVAVSELAGAMATLAGLLIFGVEDLSVVATVAVIGYSITTIAELAWVAPPLWFSANRSVV